MDSADTPVNLDGEQRQKLLERIRSKRQQVAGWLKQNERRTSRISNATIIASSMAAVLMIGPGVGGEKFTIRMAQLLSVPDDSLVWRALCLAALLISVGIAILNRLNQSPDTAMRLATARLCLARLEGLESAVEVGTMSVADGLKQYQQYINDVPFIRDAT
ncbi:MAG: hypothetical protein U0641_19845 [Anaerolineae bacterium]